MRLFLRNIENVEYTLKECDAKIRGSEKKENK